MAEKKGSTRGGVGSRLPSEWAYNVAHDVLSSEIEDFAFEPRGYLKSMGWDVTNLHSNFLEKVADEFDIPYEDYVELARLIERLYDAGMSDYEILNSDEVEDFVANIMAKEINRAIRSVRRKEGNTRKPTTKKTTTKKSTTKKTTTKKPSNKRK